MPTITFLSSKGGTGKTTAALTLAVGIAQKGARIAVVDADPNLPLLAWRRMAQGLDNLVVFPAPTPADLGPALDKARLHPWVVVDTEGSARAWEQVAAIVPDLVLIPLGPSPLEVAEAIRTSKTLYKISGVLKRPLAHACVFARLPAAIRARSFHEVVRRLKAERIDIIETPLIDKEAFRAMFWSGATMASLDPSEVSGLEAARANADQFSANILALFAPGGPLAGSFRPAAAAAASPAAPATPADYGRRPAMINLALTHPKPPPTVN